MKELSPGDPIWECTLDGRLACRYFSHRHPHPFLAEYPDLRHQSGWCHRDPRIAARGIAVPGETYSACYDIDAMPRSEFAALVVAERELLRMLEENRRRQLELGRRIAEMAPRSSP